MEFFAAGDHRVAAMDLRHVTHFIINFDVPNVKDYFTNGEPRLELQKKQAFLSSNKFKT